MTSRSLKIALAVSVALNVFAVAAVGAVWVSRDKIEHRVAEAHKSGRNEPVWDVIERMDPAVRDQVKAQLRAAAMQARPDFEEARAARREAIALTGGETFDPVAVAALLERSRASEARGRSRLETGAVETLNQLSPADRKALAPILSRHKAKREARKPEKADKPVAPVAAASAAR
ncbi:MULTISPECIES: periplasmic heavy metal sensor [unclassified Brevundimonas]|uniref:periplasmic heavy metal sensor n=1 Tax=unclassified Brevundimonas TaxID=2622653 RepID=UPI0025BE50AC|nr:MULTISPECIES: periplasmic heavy metal sensor [unclassified Brevundimonas]